MSVRIESRSQLDQAVLDEILELIEQATSIDGHRPVGEHKYSHLAVGAPRWAGVLARDGGRLVGYAHTRWNSPGRTPRMAVEVVVHPDYRGSDVARNVLLETRSLLAHAGGGTLYLWVHHVEDADATLASQLGFDVQRELAFLTAEMAQPPPQPALPDGVTLRSYRSHADDDEFLRVNNAAFAGHPENGAWDHGDFADRRALEWFDPEGLLMAWRGTTCVGFHWTKWHGHASDQVPAHDPVGEVYVLAVDPAERGSGLGRALLRAGLRHLHDRGCRRAVLYVDTANTGAVRLYESEGFSMAYSEVCYADFVAPVVDQASTDLLRPAF